mgnify:CR=1 FL=1
MVDVGAYIGKYTIFACKRAEKVIAIEPIPVNFAVLKQNVRLNFCESKVFLVNKAIDAVRRKVNVYPYQRRKTRTGDSFNHMEEFRAGINDKSASGAAR